MVKIVNSKNDIIKLWNEAFGDSEEDITLFINNVRDAICLGYYDNNNLKSMMYLVNCSLGKYIYVACTLKKHNGKGYMTRLLDYCKSNYNNVCLIPANESLIDFYKKRGFSIEESVNNLKFNQIDIINEYLFDGCSLKKPIVLVYKGEK